MIRLGRGTVWVGLGLTAALLTIACVEDPTGSGGGGGNISDPAVLEQYVQQAFIPGIIGVMDGIDRLIIAASGGTADGVVITPSGAQIMMDLDGDGTRESTVNGLASGDFATGADVAVVSADVPGDEVVDLNMTMTVAAGPGMALVDNIGGFISADPPGSGNAATVTFNSGSVSINTAAGIPNGGMDCEVRSEGITLFLGTQFEPDGQGGWRARFIGEEFEFTVP